MEKPLYFAYGSNINLDQMQYRCPDATVYGQAVLDNYDLRFRGSGVATVEPKEGACVYGLLWELTDKCEASLDRYEGYPRLYIKQTLEVRTFDGQRVPVMAYITQLLQRDRRVDCAERVAELVFQDRQPVRLF